MGAYFRRYDSFMGVALNDMPVALTVAGSDCSSGAGAQADLKTFSAHGVYGLTALTCVVAEVPGKVSRIDEVAPEMLAEQLRVLMEAFPVRAMKTGMVPTSAHVDALGAVLDGLPEVRLPELVVDPVMVATSGDRLVDDQAIEALSTTLFPRARVLTPNMGEASVLLGRDVADASDLEAAALDLAEKFRVAVLVKGGHLPDGTALDVLATRSGETRSFEAPFIGDRNTHGTGCTLSSAIASNLALGKPLEQAIAPAKRYVHRAIDHILAWETGEGRLDALNHFSLPGA